MRWMPGLDAALDEIERSSMAASAKNAHARRVQPASAAGLAFLAVFAAGLAADLVAGLAADRLRVAGFAEAPAAAEPESSEAVASAASAGLVVRLRVVRAFGLTAAPAGSSEADSTVGDSVVADAAADLVVVRARRTGLAGAAGSSVGTGAEA